MVRALLPVLLLGWAGEAHAQAQTQTPPQTYLTVTLASYHFNRDRQYNERNFGLGIERRLSDDWSVSTGFYKNSFYRDSLYALASYTSARLAGWRLGVVFGGVTGYNDGLCPWVTGLATRDFGGFGINVVLGTAGVALQAKYSTDGRFR